MGSGHDPRMTTMTTHGMNGKRILIIVDPNTAKATRFVLTSPELAGEFELWLRGAGIRYRRDTTVFGAITKPTDEQARCYKLLMDFRRNRGSVIDLGSVQ